MNNWQKLQIHYYRLERLLTRRLRNVLFRRIWHKDLPIAMITGSHGKTTTSRMLANILKHAGHTVGLANSDGVFIDSVQQKPGDGAGYYGARRVLNNKTVTAAVLETGAGSVSLNGLYVERCNVATLLNLFPEHIGEYRVKSADHLAKLKRQIVSCANDALIVNMEDEHCLQMMGDIRPSRLIAYALNPDNADLAAALAAGHTCLTTDRDRQYILLKKQGDTDQVIARVDQIPATSSGLVFHNVANAMAAAGLALGLGVDLQWIREGLESFDQSIDRFATRFNIITDHEFEIIIDKALGPAALSQSLAAQDRLRVAGKKYCLLTSLGNRSDDVLEKMSEQLVGKFDRYIVHDVAGFRRGKPAGEVVVRYVNALRKCGVPQDAIIPADDVADAIDKLGPLLASGDRVFAQYMQHKHLVALTPKLRTISGDIASARSKKAAP